VDPSPALGSTRSELDRAIFPGGRERADRHDPCCTPSAMTLRAPLALAAVLLVAACNSALGIERAETISDDSDLSDGQDERSGFEIKPAGPQKNAVSPTQSGAKCASGLKLCFDKCVAIDDPRYGCTLDTCTGCAFPHTSRTTCKAGACAVLECEETYENCNGDSADGCETDFYSSRTCGACDNACPDSARFCVNMTCSPEPS
jgi:hypothetical protein